MPGMNTFLVLNREVACEILYLCIFERIHDKQLNFRSISEAYPATDLYDEVCLEHLGKILEMCNDVMFLTLSHGQPVKWILNHLPTFVRHLEGHKR